MLAFKSCKLRDVGLVPLPTSLAWLILTDNELSVLPDSFGDLTSMRKLMLANNRLSSLPRSMSRMRELELLRLANNRFEALPPWLSTLPKLSWLALAGNPCIRPAPARAALPTVRYSDLAFGSRLGEGTSSIVYKGTWRDQTVRPACSHSPLAICSCPEAARLHSRRPLADHHSPAPSLRPCAASVRRVRAAPASGRRQELQGDALFRRQEPGRGARQLRRRPRQCAALAGLRRRGAGRAFPGAGERRATSRVAPRWRP